MSLSQNGTLKCHIVCPFLTEKIFDPDESIYYCKYEEWTYAIVAFVLVIATILPCGYILSCAARRRKRKRKRLLPQLSSQISASSTDGSRLGYSHDSEYERFHSPILEGPSSRYHGANIGPYGTFSSLPDTFEQMAYQQYQAARNPYRVYSQGDVRPQGTIGGSLSGLPFDFSHFEDKNVARRKTSGFSEDSSPVKQHSQDKGLYPDLTSSLNGTNHKLLNSEAQYIENINGCPDIASTDQDQQAENNQTRTSTNENSIDIPSNEKSNADNNGMFVVGDNSTGTSRDDLEEDELGSSPYIYALPTRKDFEDFLFSCVSKKPEDERNGTFLVRESKSNPENRVLMVYCKSTEVPNNIFYFKICWTNTGRVYVEGPANDSFDSVDELIAYHRQYRSFFPCFLAECLGTKFSFRPTLNPNLLDLSIDKPQKC